MGSIFNFNEYETENASESVYKTDNGNLIKQDWECIKDFYPEKWLKINMSEQKEDEIFIDSKYVWVIKHKGVIKAVLSDTTEEKIAIIFDSIKNNM